jgi:hypothetical protein
MHIHVAASRSRLCIEHGIVGESFKPVLCLTTLYLVPVQVLPPHLGGTAELVPVQECWQRILQQRQQQQESAGAACDRSSMDCARDAQQQQQQQLCDLAPELRFSGPGSADAAVLIQTT